MSIYREEAVRDSSVWPEPFEVSSSRAKSAVAPSLAAGPSVMGAWWAALVSLPSRAGAALAMVLAVAAARTAMYVAMPVGAARWVAELACMLVATFGGWVFVRRLHMHRLGRHEGVVTSLVMVARRAPIVLAARVVLWLEVLMLSFLVVPGIMKRVSGMHAMHIALLEDAGPRQSIALSEARVWGTAWTQGGYLASSMLLPGAVTVLTLLAPRELLLQPIALPIFAAVAALVAMYTLVTEAGSYALYYERTVVQQGTTDDLDRELAAFAPTWSLAA